MKYGRLPALDGRHVPRLSQYLAAPAAAMMSAAAAAPLPAAPPACNWAAPLPSLLMYQNDKLGCCEVRAAAELVRTWTANAGDPFDPTDDQVIAEYSALSGYNPATGQNDNGVATLDLLERWRTVGLFGHKIDAYATLDWSDPAQVKLGTDLFGGTLFGVRIYAEDERLFYARQMWDLPEWPSAFQGLHCVPIMCYDESLFYPDTWAQFQATTPRWLANRTDEAYVVVSVDFLNAQGQTPAGLNLTQLLADAQALSSSS
jgi:hypothetical protein